MRLLLCLFLSCMSFSAFAQGNASRTCGTEAYATAVHEQFPELREQQRVVLQSIKQALQKKKQSGQNMQMGKITIPVVFHVVYNTPEQNISDEQIYSQLAILNADFSRTNADAANTPSYFADVAADTGIEFCLAIIDPVGDPTTGITRTQTPKESFSPFTDNVKSTSSGGIDAWDTQEYLNIWVCPIEGQTLGYASSPGVTSARRDGVVLLYSSVGAPPYNNFQHQFNLGRTATHEVGHWLGLNHLWGKGTGSNFCPDQDDEENDDAIEDTPPQIKPTQGCPDSIVLSCNSGPNGVMWQNYMDYSDDACMNLFTKGQATYMNAAIVTARAALFRSLACTGELRSNFTTQAPEDTLINAGGTVQFKDAYEGARPTSWLWEFEGGSPATSTKQNPTVTYSKPGRYNVKLTISNGQMSSTVEKEQMVYVTANELVIYPVPASDYLIIEQPADVELRHIQLVNHIGQLILSEPVEGRVIRLDVSNLKPGVYFLKVRGSEGVSSKKIVLAR